MRRLQGQGTHVRPIVPSLSDVIPSSPNTIGARISRCERILRRFVHRLGRSLWRTSSPLVTPPAAGSGSGSSASAGCLGLGCDFGLLGRLGLLDRLLLRDLLLDRGFGGCVLLLGQSLGLSGFRRLGLLDRLQLLLGRQLAALGHDEHARLHGHLGEELDRNLVAADPLQRLVEADLPAVDPDLELVPDRVREVRLRDRPEEDALLAGLDVEAELRLAEPLRDLLRLLDALRLVQRAARVHLLELLDARGRGRLRELARQEEVSRVPARDVDDLAAQAELVHVFPENDLHRQFET